jgi:hypothetical protein
MTNLLLNGHLISGWKAWFYYGGWEAPKLRRYSPLAYKLGLLFNIYSILCYQASPMTIDSRRLKCISHTPFISKSPIVTSLKPLLTNKLVDSILPTYLLFSIRISKTRPYLREGCCLFEVHGRTRLNAPQSGCNPQPAALHRSCRQLYSRGNWRVGRWRLMYNG